MDYNKCKTAAEVLRLAQHENPARRLCELYGWGYLPHLNKLHAERWENHRTHGSGTGDVITGVLVWWSRELGVAVTENSVYQLVGDEKQFIG